MEVEETFVAGVSHGLRTRWHANGQKKSEEHIEHGVVTGRHVEWHDNGRKAVEMTLKAGHPGGLAEAWHPDETLKSQTQFEGGKALLASLSPNDTQLGALGYSKMQTFPGHDWVPSADASAPSPRARHTAIRTGTRMIVWGGAVSTLLSNQGGEYAADPKTWTLLASVNAPAARGDHTAVWTGTNISCGAA